MVSPPANPDRDGCVGQAFNGISDFEIVLAISVCRRPPRRDAVRSIAPDERIIQALRHLVTECGYVFESRREESVRNPARIIQHISFLAEIVARIPGLVVVSVKSEHTAMVRIAVEI